jgi:hypothetical protein
MKSYVELAAATLPTRSEDEQPWNKNTPLKTQGFMLFVG